MTFEPRHVPGALRLSQEMGWPYRREDWEVAAALGQGLVLERAGDVIGTAMWWTYGQAHASAGMINVTASAQGGGFGSRLFDGLLEATDGRNVLLNSTEEGLALYERRGFTAWGTVLQHQGWLSVAVERDARDGVRTATASDLAAIQAFDERATGLPRPSMVAALADLGDVAVIDRGGRVAGYAIARRWGRGHVIGPVAAESAEDAQRLTLAQLSKLHGQFVRIDIHAEHGLGGRLEGLGLERVGHATAMVKGRRPIPEGLARACTPWRTSRSVRGIRDAGDDHESARSGRHHRCSRHPVAAAGPGAARAQHPASGRARRNARGDAAPAHEDGQEHPRRPTRLPPAGPARSPSRPSPRRSTSPARGFGT